MLFGMTWRRGLSCPQFLRPQLRFSPRLELRGVDATLATQCALQSCGFHVDMAYVGQQSRSQITGQDLLFSMLSGIATGLSWVCYFHALQAGPASESPDRQAECRPGHGLCKRYFLGEHLTCQGLWRRAGLRRGAYRCHGIGRAVTWPCGCGSPNPIVGFRSCDER